MALLLLGAAEVQNKRNSHRETLVMLTRAERRLPSLGGKLGLLGEDEDRNLDGKRLHQERIELEATRSPVLASMAVSEPLSFSEAVTQARARQLATASTALDVPPWTCQIGPTRFEHARSMMPKFHAASGNPGMALPETRL